MLSCVDAENGDGKESRAGPVARAAAVAVRDATTVVRQDDDADRGPKTSRHRDANRRRTWLPRPPRDLTN